MALLDNFWSIEARLSGTSACLLQMYTSSIRHPSLSCLVPDAKSMSNGAILQSNAWFQKISNGTTYTDGSLAVADVHRKLANGRGLIQLVHVTKLHLWIDGGMSRVRFRRSNWITESVDSTVRHASR